MDHLDAHSLVSLLMTPPKNATKLYVNRVERNWKFQNKLKDIKCNKAHILEIEEKISKFHELSGLKIKNQVDTK